MIVRTLLLTLAFALVAAPAFADEYINWDHAGPTTQAAAKAFHYDRYKRAAALARKAIAQGEPEPYAAWILSGALIGRWRAWLTRRESIEAGSCGGARPPPVPTPPTTPGTRRRAAACGCDATAAPRCAGARRRRPRLPTRRWPRRGGAEERSRARGGRPPRGGPSL